MRKRAFEGTARVRLDAASGRVFLDRGVAGSTLTAADVGQIVSISLEAAQKHKAGLDRWSFYVRGENEKLPQNEPKAQLDAKVVAKAIKSGMIPELRLGNFGKPVVWFDTEKPVATAKVSKYQDLG
jgi:hypothetical protein